MGVSRLVEYEMLICNFNPHLLGLNDGDKRSF